MKLIGQLDHYLYQVAKDSIEKRIHISDENMENVYAKSKYRFTNL